MERRQQLRLAAVLLMKNHYLLQRKLKLLSLKLLNNVKIMSAVANTNFDVMLQGGIAVTHSEIKARQVWKAERNGTFWENDVVAMDDKTFKEQFRLNRTTFQKLCKKVQSIEKTNSNMRLCIPLDKRVAIALYALGSTLEYRKIGDLFSVGRSTVGEIVLEFCRAVCDNLGDCINSYPPHPEEMKKVVDGFAQLGFPQCFGAVDICHIEVHPRKEQAAEYRNHKGWHSVILLASCDYKSKFTYINIGSSGRNNDSDVFEKSALKKLHESAAIFSQNSKLIGNVKVPVLLIGDAAFRLSHSMMKPFPYSPNQPAVEKTFNYRLSRCHSVIENAFHQLKARFRKTSRGLQVASENVNTVIKACCILHNFLKMEKDTIPSAWMQDIAEDVNGRSQPRYSTRAGENDATALAIRNAIALSFKDEEAA